MKFIVSYFPVLEVSMAGLLQFCNAASNTDIMDESVSLALLKRRRWLFFLRHLRKVIDGFMQIPSLVFHEKFLSVE